MRSSSGCRTGGVKRGAGRGSVGPHVPVVDVGQGLELPPVSLRGQEVVDLAPLGRVVVLHRHQPDLPGAEVQGLQDVELRALGVDGQVVDAPGRIPVRQEVVQGHGGHLVPLPLRPRARQAVPL